LDRLQTITGFTDDPKALFRLEQGAETPPHDMVVIGQ
jgi:hypothetical protein